MDNIQLFFATNSTDVELKTIFSTVKKLIAFSHFLTSSSIHFQAQQPIILFVDNKPAINIITQTKISNFVIIWTYPLHFPTKNPTKLLSNDTH